MEAVDVMALQIRSASSGEMVFSTAATMSLDLLVYLCLVDSLQLLKSDHFLSADVDSSVSYTFKINNKLENPFNSHYSLNRFAAFFDFVRIRG